MLLLLKLHGTLKSTWDFSLKSTTFFLISNKSLGSSWWGSHQVLRKVDSSLALLSSGGFTVGKSLCLFVIVTVRQR